MIRLQRILLFCTCLTCLYNTGATAGEIVRIVPNATVKMTPKLLTICLFIEDDSYYTTAQRLAAAVDLSVSHANQYVLHSSLMKIQVRFQSTGSSCTKTDFTATSSAYTLLQSGVTCNAFLGAG